MAFLSRLLLESLVPAFDAAGVDRQCRFDEQSCDERVEGMPVLLKRASGTEWRLRNRRP